jgi:bacillopeptidase F (M6 metalloprotease family)
MTTDVYTVLHKALGAALGTGEITTEQAKQASLWLDLQETLNQTEAR